MHPAWRAVQLAGRRISPYWLIANPQVHPSHARAREDIFREGLRSWTPPLRPQIRPHPRYRPLRGTWNAEDEWACSYSQASFLLDTGSTSRAVVSQGRALKGAIYGYPAPGSSSITRARGGNIQGGHLVLTPPHDIPSLIPPFCSLS